MPGQAISAEIPRPSQPQWEASRTEASIQQPTNPTKPKLTLKNVFTAVKPWVQHPGEQMRSFLGALSQDEASAQVKNTGIEATDAAQGDRISVQELETKLPISDSSRKFLKVMNKPSIVTKIIMSRMPEKPSNQQMQNEIMIQNSEFLRKFLGDVAMDSVQAGGIDMDQAVAQKVTELAESKTPQALQAMLGEADDNKVFVVRRLENALRANKATRPAAKMLRQLRKQSNYTIPRYAWSNREVFAEAAVNSQVGQQVMGKINKAAEGIRSRISGALTKTSTTLA